MILKNAIDIYTLVLNLKVSVKSTHSHQLFNRHSEQNCILLFPLMGKATSIPSQILK